MADSAWVGLGDAIKAIRRELDAAIEHGDGGSLKFQPGPLELELVVTVHLDVGGKVKILLLPWTAEVHGGRSAEHVQRVKLTLQPVNSEGGEQLIGHRSGRPE